MSLRALLLAATALGFASAAHAADLIVDTAPASVDTSFVNSGVYAQLLGGIVGGLDVQYYQDGEDDGTSSTDAGFAIAGTIGVVVMDGLSLEADVLHTSRAYTGDSDDIYSTTSLMANAKYTLSLNEMFSLYGAVGLGYVWGSEDWPVDNHADYASFGYQLIAGVGVKFTDNISGVVEYRFQDTFDKSNYTTDDQDYGLSIPNSAVLAGLKFSF